MRNWPASIAIGNDGTVAGDGEGDSADLQIAADAQNPVVHAVDEVARRVHLKAAISRQGQNAVAEAHRKKAFPSIARSRPRFVIGWGQPVGRMNPARRGCHC